MVQPKTHSIIVKIMQSSWIELENMKDPINLILSILPASPNTGIICQHRKRCGQRLLDLDSGSALFLQHAVGQNTCPICASSIPSPIG